MSGDASTDAAYLAYQYGDTERLRIRYETHRRYSVEPDNFRGWVIDQADVRPNARVLDVGCGPGTYHTALIAKGARVTGLDTSRAMIVDALAGSRSNRYPVSLTCGTADALPYADRSFDRVMANHVLYHVHDIPLALREIRRVLRPGGRSVLSTNGSDPGRLFALHKRACNDCGLLATSTASARFTLDDLAVVQAVFPEARVLRLENALSFPTAEPALRYYASYQVDEIEDRPGDGSHRERLLRRMHQLIDEVIAAEGELRVPKVAGCFIADV